MLNAEQYARRLEEKKKSSKVFRPVYMVTDIDEVEKFEQVTGKVTGIIENTPYFSFCLDVYHNVKTDKSFRYCSIAYPKNKAGGCVLIVLHTAEQTYFLLNEQYRPIVDMVCLEIPRGFTEVDKDNSVTETVLRELFEETNLEVNPKKLRSLGHCNPDSGVLNVAVELFLVEYYVEDVYAMPLKSNDTNETVLGHRFIEERELCKLINEGEITDVFTMTAYLKYKLLRDLKS